MRSYLCPLAFSTCSCISNRWSLRVKTSTCFHKRVYSGRQALLRVISPERLPDIAISEIVSRRDTSTSYELVPKVIPLRNIQKHIRWRMRAPIHCFCHLFSGFLVKIPSASILFSLVSVQKLLSDEPFTSDQIHYTDCREPSAD